jgi:hypothetical protein
MHAQREYYQSVRDWNDYGSCPDEAEHEHTKITVLKQKLEQTIEKLCE